MLADLGSRPSPSPTVMREPKLQPGFDDYADPSSPVHAPITPRSAFVAGAGLALTLLYPGHPTAVFAACAAICGTAAPALALPAAK